MECGHLYGEDIILSTTDVHSNLMYTIFQTQRNSIIIVLHFLCTENIYKLIFHFGGVSYYITNIRVLRVPKKFANKQDLSFNGQVYFLKKQLSKLHFMIDIPNQHDATNVLDQYSRQHNVTMGW